MLIGLVARTGTITPSCVVQDLGVSVQIKHLNQDAVSAGYLDMSIGKSAQGVSRDIAGAVRQCKGPERWVVECRVAAWRVCTWRSLGRMLATHSTPPTLQPAFRCCPTTPISCTTCPFIPCMRLSNCCHVHLRISSSRVHRWEPSLQQNDGLLASSCAP